MKWPKLLLLKQVTEASAIEMSVLEAKLSDIEGSAINMISVIKLNMELLKQSYFHQKKTSGIEQKLVLSKLVPLNPLPIHVAKSR
jgi:hypothetical protein